jgi:folate-binding protein YgfZ
MTTLAAKVGAMTLQEQIQAIDEGALVRAMPELSTIAVTGPDRQTWLAGMVTNEVKSLPAGSGAYALSVNRNGRLQAETYVLVDEDRILLGVRSELAAELLEAMNQYLIMEDAELEPVDPSPSWWLAHGPKAELVAAAAREADATVGMGQLGELSTAFIALARGERAHPSPGELLTRPEGALLATPEGWERIRIERMIPRYGVDFEKGCYPQEACLESLAVSFNKGCYLGQEAVFMLEKRGHAANRLVRLVLDGDAPPERGAVISTTDGDEVGKVTSSITDDGKAWVIGRVRYKHTASGTELRIGDSATTVS